ncbi:MAG: hypothetical protein PHW82_08955 [Bacteroidales bacterium]|nr:hypothetical protein [Bacteroidales bacterium]
MALNTEILKQAIKTAYLSEQSEERNANDSADRIADKIATAVVAQIKALTITYVTGLTTSTGPVTGAFTCTLS